MASDIRMSTKIGGIFVGSIILSFAVIGLGGLRYNYSPSVPTGWYILSDELVPHFVEFCPPEPFASLAKERDYTDFGFSCPGFRNTITKRILGRPGDLIMVAPSGLRLNGIPIPNSRPLFVDSKGRHLIGWMAGSYVVTPDEYWVIGDDPRSFDSRYYGPVPERSVRDFLRSF